ncbi:MAG: SdrD B-like domain-containing protein [Saprospiraceae bacterium]
MLLLWYGTKTKTYDFGFFCPATVFGTVWMDSDTRGDLDGSEMKIAGVTVTLHDAATDAVIGTSVVSDIAGQFTLDNIPAGTYYVAFTTIPAGKIPTYKDITGDDETDSDVYGNGHTDAFSVGTCDFINFDLGLRNIPTNPATICGTMQDDLDKDGVFDASKQACQG